MQSNDEIMDGEIMLEIKNLTLVHERYVRVLRERRCLYLRKDGCSFRELFVIIMINV